MAEKKRFYNAGDKFSETLLYSLPDGHDVHCVARHTVEVPAQGFFEVPTEMELGAATIHVDFYKDLMRRYGARGLILVDRNRDPRGIAETEAVASSDAEAQTKGAERWRDFLQEVVQRHVEQCEAIRASGGAPLQARGFTRHAFNVLGLEDPAALANRVNAVPTPAPADDRIAGLEAQIKLLSEQLVSRQAQPELALEGGKKGK